MYLLKKEINQRPLGVWIALFALFLIYIAWFMQIYSLINWESAISFGFQGASFKGDAADRILADVERGVAIADILWALPISIIALIGLLREKYHGFIAAMMVFAICIYFPLFYAFRESMNFNTKLAALSLWAIPSLLGIYGLWVNKNIYNIQ